MNLTYQCGMWCYHHVHATCLDATIVWLWLLHGTWAWHGMPCYSTQSVNWLTLLPSTSCLWHHVNDSWLFMLNHFKSSASVIWVLILNFVQQKEAGIKFSKVFVIPIIKISKQYSQVAVLKFHLENVLLEVTYHQRRKKMRWCTSELVCFTVGREA